MSKRSQTSDPPIPKKMHHAERPFSEDTQKALEYILSENLKTSRKANKAKFKDDEYLIDGAYGKRRREAIRRTFDSVVSHYELTARTNGLVPTAELWSNLNQYVPITPEFIDQHTSILSGAAIWFLDHVEQRFELEEMLSGIDYDEDFDRPYFFDPSHDYEVVEATIHVLLNRTASEEYYIHDTNAEPGPTADAFNKLLSYIDTNVLRRAIARTKATFWKWVDGFFQIEYALAERYMAGIKRVNESVDAFNREIDVLSSAVDEFKTWRDKPTSFKKGNAVLMNPTPKDILSPLETGRFPRAPLPFDLTNPLANLERIGERLDRLNEKTDKAWEDTYDIQADMVRFVFDYAQCGFTSADHYLGHFADTVLPIPAGDISDPYELCAGLLLMCSPNALATLYHDIPGGAGDAEELPWLLGAMGGLISDIAAHLPWGVNYYEEDMVEFEEPRKPLPHPDWYKRDYREYDVSRNLAQIIYETTGAILPRNMSEFDDAYGVLKRNGIKRQKASQIAELMTLLNEPHFRTRLMTVVPDYIPSNESENVNDLRKEIRELREQLKKATDASHSSERKARRAEQELIAEREKMAADRRELAGLREVIFSSDQQDDDNAVSVPLPYDVKQRIVVYGGHDTWLKGMKEHLTGNIRFIDKGQAIIDRTVIRNADIVWIQTNALPHRQYYAIIDEVRKLGIPVRYFLYASARKCAEQIALDDKD